MMQAPTHPVLSALADVTAAIDDLSSAPVELMRVSDKRAALVAVHRAESQLAAAKLRLIAASGQVAEADGARDVASWVAATTRRDAGTTRRDQRLAVSITHRWRAVSTALAAGAMNAAQAEVVVRELDRLADQAARLGIGHRDLSAAETELVDRAADFSPRELRILARRIIDVVAPQIAEDAEQQALLDEERRAEAATELSISRDGHGSAFIRVKVPEAAAVRLTTYLEAFTNPRREDAVLAEGASRASRYHDATGERRPYAHRLGQAFCALLETLDPARLPSHGGDATQVVVTVDLDALRTGVGAAWLGDSARISAAEARRLACTAGVMPAVLGAASQPLDLGRSRRLFSSAQRRALRIRDRGCRADGCTIPATWCEAHHPEPWSHGGTTDLANGLLLCHHHHHRAHDDAYRSSPLPDGRITFHRRC